MPNTQSEADKFFESLPDETQEEQFNFFEEKKPEPEAPTPEKAPEPEEEPEKPEKPLNRAERRREQNKWYEEQLRDRDERIQRLETAVLQRSNESNEEYDSRLTRLFGDTPQGKEASRIVQELLKETKEQAIAPYKELEAAQQAEREAEASFDRQIEDGLADVEDTFGVDLTSRSARKTRAEFLDFVEELSPEDSFVSFEKAWELFQVQQKATPSADEIARKKQVASRSVQRSGSARPDPSKLQPMNFEQVDNFFTKMFRR